MSQQQRRHLVIFNPTAGNGRCRKKAPAGLAHLREQGVQFDVVETQFAGHASEIARDAYAAGRRDFLAIGGDGTSYEIINGLYPLAAAGGSERPRLGFLPMGTGNSFLRDFSTGGLAYALTAITEGRTRPCDVIKLRHRDGELHYINILSMGFVADVCALRNRSLSRFGEAGYILGVFAEVARLRTSRYNMRVDDGAADDEPLAFVSFNNSRFTGGKMMMAPEADTSDGKIALVRVQRMGRAELLRTFPRIFSGTHVNHPLISQCKVDHVDFALDHPVDVMVDGEVLTVTPERLEVLPSALEVMA